MLVLMWKRGGNFRKLKVEAIARIHRQRNLSWQGCRAIRINLERQGEQKRWWIASAMGKADARSAQSFLHFPNRWTPPA
jgi:hypothetical protein